jgi:hypothetical protein
MKIFQKISFDENVNVLIDPTSQWKPLERDFQNCVTTEMGAALNLS